MYLYHLQTKTGVGEKDMIEVAVQTNEMIDAF